MTMRVKTLMRTRFVTISDDTTLQQARALLAREQIETIPVMRAGSLVGLLRARDLERLGPSSVPALAVHDWAFEREALTVRAALTGDPPTVDAEASVHDTVRLLVSQELDAVPVLEGATLVGLVTTRDLLAVLLERLQSDRRPGFEHVLVAVDLGAGTAPAVANGQALARQHGARLTLLHVLPTGSRKLLSEGIPREMLDWSERQQRESCLRELAALVPDEAGLEVGRLVVSGALPSAIVAVATRLAVDLIVIGGHSRRRFLGPSLTEALIARAPCPVLVVRSGGDTAMKGRPAHARA